MWVAKLDGHDLTSAEKTDFNEWLHRSPKHRQEFQTYAEPWDAFDESWREEAFANNDNPTMGALWNKAKYASAIAATVAIVFLSSLFLVDHQNTQSHPAFYSSEIGHQKTVALGDGSQIQLNTNSQIEVLFSDHNRKIRLIKGEAWFDVAHDKTKPFLVYAGTGVVKAVGTAFAVQLHNDNIEVTVTEGRVELAAYAKETEDIHIDVMPENKPKVLAQIEAGQRAEFDTVIEIIETVPTDVIEKELSWQSGLLIFDGESLEDVVKDFSRYTNIEFVITNSEIRDMKITGYFQTNNTTAFLNTLGNNFDIKVEHVNDKEVYLTKE